MWLAEAVTGALRAVKIVYREDFSDERTFEREFEGILKFEPISRDHPGLVHILHVGRSEGEEPFYYYVMELGDDAHEPGVFNAVEYTPRTIRTDSLNQPDEPLDTAFVIETGRRLAEALGHLHDRGLTHRDVKPSNVIFVEGKAKLADIGLVAALNQRTFVGTEGFVPPEGPGSAAADVYSLGKVLYEMATGMDRLQFPELPVGGVPAEQRKSWIRLNRVICDVCEPRVERRKIQSARALAAAMSSLEEGKRPRRRIGRTGKLVLGALCLLLAVMYQGWVKSSWGITEIEGQQEPQPLRYKRVVLLSEPTDVAVLDLEGEKLGTTKYNFPKLEVETVHEVTLSKEGYRDQVLTFRVNDGEEKVQIVSAEMVLDAPPERGEVWTDAVGMRYYPERDGHFSQRYVSLTEWTLFREQTGAGEKFQVIKLVVQGEERSVVSVPYSGAEEYTVWLTALCRERGYLREKTGSADNELIAVQDQDFPAALLPQSGEERRWRPFRCEVRTIPYARLRVESDPPEASLYVANRYVGLTPWDGVLPPGVHSYTVQLEGYQSQTENVDLGDRDDVRRLVQLKLRPEVVTFGKHWENSLSMDFVPLGDELMVCRTETTRAQYQRFLLQTGREWKAPEFRQGADHPVVNVSRADALAFCAWLTDLEQSEKSQRIQEKHRYRLPTDAEWSRMAKLPERQGTPEERDAELGNELLYPWGFDEWPPPEGRGNYNEFAIEGYEDGFEFTAPVGSFKPSDLGLFDLGGNVFEWVQDDYSPGSKYAVARGAGWLSYDPDHLTLRYRDLQVNGAGSPSHGFRVVLAKVDEVEEEVENGEAD